MKLSEEYDQQMDFDCDTYKNYDIASMCAYKKYINLLLFADLRNLEHRIGFSRFNFEFCYPITYVNNWSFKKYD